MFNDYCILFLKNIFDVFGVDFVYFNSWVWCWECRVLEWVLYGCYWLKGFRWGRCLGVVGLELGNGRWVGNYFEMSWSNEEKGNFWK